MNVNSYLSLTEIGKMTRMSSKMMAQMRLMNKKEDEVIAQMMSKGLTKGITKLEEAMNKYNDEDEEALLLADKLRQTLKNNLEGLKIYL